MEVKVLNDMNNDEDMIKSFIEEFTREAFKVIASEHDQMPKTCPKCGGEMRFKLQKLIIEEDFVGDELTYECKTCGYEITKRFSFPPNYAKYFKNMLGKSKSEEK